MTEALLHRFTSEEYHRMAETGVLAPDAWVELFDGQVIDMLPIGPFHSSTVSRLTRSFESVARDRYITSVQGPLQLSEIHEPQPDLMLLKSREDFYADQLPTPSDVYLLVEVSDSTLTFDRAKKLPAYAEAGVLEVWLLNVPDRLIEVYREPLDGSYRSTNLVRAGEALAPLAFPDVRIDTRALLGRH